MHQFAPYIVPIVTAVTALILLMAGARLLKPAIGLCGALLGIGIGFLLSPSLAINVSPFLVALMSGIVGAVLAVIVARFAILLILGIIFAVGAPVITWHATGLGDGSQVIEDVITAATSPDSEDEEVSDEEVSNSTPITMTTEDAVSVAFLTLTYDATKATRIGIQRANAAWSAIPTGAQLMLAGSALAGLLIGLLVSTFMPYFSSAIVTSCVGSLLLIASVRNGMASIWSLDTITQMSPMMLTILAASIAVAGLGVQLTVCRKPSNTKHRVPKQAKV